MLICKNCNNYITTFYFGNPPEICEPCIKNNRPINASKKAIKRAKERLEDSLKQNR